MSTLSVNTSFNISLKYTSAPVVIRALAYIIDNTFLGIYLFILMTYIVPGLGLDKDQAGLWYLFYLPFAFYHILFEILNHGQSPGKMVVGIRVVGDDGKEESNTQAMVRWLMRTIDFGIWLGVALIVFNEEYFISIIFILCHILSRIVFLTTEYNQRLGDLAAGTVVVYKKLPYDLNDTIFRDLQVDNYTVQFPQVMKLSDNDLNIIDNVLKRHKKSEIEHYLRSVTEKVKTALVIESELDDHIFLETLMNDYNYLSRQ